MMRSPRSIALARQVLSPSRTALAQAQRRGLWSSRVSAMAMKKPNVPSLLRNYSSNGGANGSGSQGKKRGLLDYLKRVAEFTVVLIAVPVGYTLAFFVYDYTTYEGGPLMTNVSVPINSLALKRGGPKNLPLVDSFIDDIELEHTNDKPNLLVLGSGWGAVAFLTNLDTSKYNVTVVSPTNHFLFTPLLPSAAVGTLSLDTLVEPMHHICRKKNVRFIQAAGHDVAFEDRLLEVRSDNKDLGERHFYIPYDKLIIATGAGTNTHGVKGMEHCLFFKTAADSEKVRDAICRTLELASLPSTSEQERRRLLSFVICGGGPTGVELAAEIYDLLKEDVPKLFPNLLVNLASVHIIQSRSAILNTYDETISKYAMDRFMRDGIDLQTNARVQEVKDGSVLFTKREKDGSTMLMSVPAGVTLWTTGVGLSRFVQRVINNLQDSQHNRRAIETDSHLRVIGAPKGEVYAIGDASTVRLALADELESLIRAQLKTKVDYNEEYELKTVDECLLQILRNEPQARQHIINLRDKLHKWYQPEDHIHLNRVIEDLKRVDKKVTSLPATAQRANQQGSYLGKKLNRLALVPEDSIKQVNDADEQFARPFAYHHLGSLAYISNDAVFDTNSQIGFNLFGGVLAMYLWRSVYMSQTVTYRARVHMFFDWLYRGLFGRQIYSYERVAKNIDEE